VRWVICGSPAYFSRRNHPTCPDDLQKHTAISFQGLATPSVWRFEANGKEIVASVRSRLSVNTVEAAIDAAEAGMGLTRALSYQVVERVRRGSLAVTLEDFKLKPWPVHLLYNRQSRLPLKMRAFIDFVPPRLRQRLTEAEF